MVVGSGVVGASIAYHLARRGAEVQLLDERQAPGCGVTGHAFGWINLVNGSSTANPASYRLRLQAIEDFRRLETEFPEAFEGVRCGSIVWEKTPAMTEARAREHQAWGAPIELVDAAAIALMEPSLRDVPDCAAFSPDDIAIDPGDLSRALVRAAVSAGATANFGIKVTSVETLNGRATGVRTAGDIIDADAVVIAAGTAVDTLTSALGANIGVESSPCVLLRYQVEQPFITRILCGSELEIRQANDHSLIVATSYVEGAEDDAAMAIGHRFLEAIGRSLAVPGEIAFRKGVVGYRPFFADGFPRLGFLPQVEGVYVAVGHPGVILAPLLGRLATEALLDDRHSSLVPDL
nr:FAD-dependent oxidoreductase [Rhizobium tubonense]